MMDIFSDMLNSSVVKHPKAQCLKCTVRACESWKQQLYLYNLGTDDFSTTVL